MAIRITRFYYDFDEDCRTGCLAQLAFEDMDTTKANEFEENLKEQKVSYIRVDL